MYRERWIEVSREGQVIFAGCENRSRMLAELTGCAPMDEAFALAPGVYSVKVSELPENCMDEDAAEHAADEVPPC